jgi:hypothetical protein
VGHGGNEVGFDAIGLVESFEEAGILQCHRSELADPTHDTALLFAEFLLSREGQEFFKSVNRVPASLAVDTPLNKFPHEIIDPAIALDEGEKWDRLWSQLFLGGKPVERGE